jgi:polyhydroxybutyrate depolymerase
MSRPWLLLLAATLVGCPGPGDDDDATEAAPEPLFGPEFIGGARPARVIAPTDYDGLDALPVIVLLHGYGASGELIGLHFGYDDRVDVDRFFLVVPEGTTDSVGKSFWNARPDSAEAVDDVAYLTSLLDAMEEGWRVDTARVYFAGHSNGGYMSYRMACERAERITGIFPFAGLSPYADEADCAPGAELSVLHAHGTEDDQVPYAPTDGRLGAEALAASWAARAGCAAASTEGPALDLVPGIEGAEAAVRDWTDGCVGGTSTSLWTLDTAGHSPWFSEAWAAESIGWLLSHSK